MFEFPLSETEQYWVGYLRADGSISRRPRQTKSGLKIQKILVFGQKHEQPVQELAKFLGCPGLVRSYDYPSFDRPTKMYVHNNFRVAHRLDEIGLKTDLDPSLYESYHFWRGLMDGDGSVGTYIRGRTGLPCPSMSCSGSETDIRMFSRWIGELLNCQPPAVSRRSNFRLALGGSKARAVALYLYENEYSALGYKQAAALEMKSWSPKRVTKNTVG